MLKVLAVPAFEDNYLWLIHNGRSAAVVDPGDAAPILTALAELRLKLVAILLTHHHADHVGGVSELKKRFDVPVFGPKDPRIDGITVEVDQGDAVTLPELELELTVVKVPGHTLTHIAYHSAAQGWLFCGDTLFGAGCGRLFEGTPQQMYDSLQKLASLPADTQVYCAHEYTLSNLRFAEAVEPKNAAIRERIALEQAKRSAGLPTLPSSISAEKATNPFLRCGVAEVHARLQETKAFAIHDEVSIFAALREWKNGFH